MRILKIILKIIVVAYCAICILLYFYQEKFIFAPYKLNKNFVFEFETPFEEKNIKTTDGLLLNGILFKTAKSKGLIFYLHGNSGALNTWGNVAKTYTDLNYDVFIIDYRGYGKSDGEIFSESQFINDIQIAYNELKKKYTEDKIIILGYSLGTGTAAKIASDNHPKLLILQAPYYSIANVMHQKLPYIPSIILKYKFETYRYLKTCSMPVVIFHGINDEAIPYQSSLQLKEFFKTKDRLITLKNQGHDGITSNVTYINEIYKILTEN